MSRDLPASADGLLRGVGPRNPENEAIESECRRLIWLHVERLPQRQALLLHLRYENNLTLSEIARGWGRWPSSVCEMHARALAALRASLAEAGIEALSHIL